MGDTRGESDVAHTPSTALAPGAPERSDQLVAAFDLAGQAVFVIDTERRILHCNQRMAELVGTTPDELIGRICVDALQCVNCLDRCLLLEEGAVCQRHAELRGADGIVVHVVKNGRMLRDAEGRVVGGIETIQDVSDLHRANSEVAREASRLARECTLLRAFAERTGEGLLSVDGAGRVTCMSPRAAELLGVSVEEGKLLGLSDLLDDDGRVPEALERLVSEGGAVDLGPLRPRRRGRGAGPLVGRLTAIPAPDGGGAIGAALLLRPRAGKVDDAPFHGIVGASTAIRKVTSLVAALSGSDATVLVTGDSGTGKEMVARALHLAGPRAARPFAAVNCATLTGELLESELFGHERGAFTGADRAKPGRLELCADGTLLLDEVGCLPPSTQAKLLRVLEQREFERVGGTRTLQLRARVVAATNANLAELVREGTFREDLYYRLKVVPIHVPPLSVRRIDIPLLVRHFVGQLSPGAESAGHEAEDGTPAGPELTPAAMSAFEGYDWPGNVRELRNAVQFALATGDGRTVDEVDLPPEVRRSAAREADPERAERAEIERALRQTLYNRARAAELLGMSRTTLWRKMRRYGLGH